MGTPFSVIFIQFYIIAALFHKINPFLKNFLQEIRFLRKSPAARGFSVFPQGWLPPAAKTCQALNFAQRNALL